MGRDTVWFSQSGKCQEGDTCQLGLHRCAAVFRGGRTCHGKHLGFERRSAKRHAVPEEAVAEEGPTQKKARFEEPEDKAEPEGAKATSSFPGKPKAKVLAMPKYVRDDSIMKRLLPELRKDRDELRGNRINPEPPRLVAKVHRKKAKANFGLAHFQRS